MAVPALSAARSLCEEKGWTVSNLELQKLLYIAHMIHLGEHGSPMIWEKFEAWDYGPVVPEVYRRAKGFGNGPVRNVFHWVDPVAVNSTELQAISDAIDATEGMTPGHLVSVTHWPQGAWHQVYKPNQMGIVIPDYLIADEYARRQAAA